MSTALAPAPAFVATAPLDRINPVARLLAALLLAAVLVMSIDPVSAGVALLLEVPLVFASGLGWRGFWARTWPVWLAAPFAGLTVALYGRAGGEVLVEWALIRVSEGSLHLALATVLRVLAIALPGVVLFARVDPTDLADGLAQVLRLPSRFVLGALAAFRLFGVLRDDWRALELARRARGIADRGRVRRFAGMAFALLVLSIRRGSTLATAMEARGFGGDTPRTWARESRFGVGGWLLLAAATLVAAIAVTVAVVTGAWTFIVR
ncbi:energy-coupling factor transporter transmembrane protein EcfT [uncultured Schumannella sp.]|uniref:energy-coupling factor transporter transmembrane component T family protein n=1 Tax=uncultured Schumannella sp. TaxID=1195956 RepID=UPI0025EBBE3F|nr:energy-coupling factor transporter transmembrane component T [uncultured Schumannella sp.]